AALLRRADGAFGEAVRRLQGGIDLRGAGGPRRVPRSPAHDRHPGTADARVVRRRVTPSERSSRASAVRGIAVPDPRSVVDQAWSDGARGHRCDTFPHSHTPRMSDSVDVIRSVLVGPPDEEMVALEAQIRAAQPAPDVGALDRLIADELLFAGPDGKLGTKAQDLEAHGSGTIRVREHEAGTMSSGR